MLLKERKFLPLFITQFLGAFNDSLLKSTVMTYITFALPATPSERGMLLTAVLILFILPFFLFSATAGQLADKYDRSKIAQMTKITELGLMILVTICLVNQWLTATLALIFLMSVQSAFFGAVKYSLVPQLLKEDELITGNAIIDGSTFFSILSGTILGVWLYHSPAGVGGILIICSVIGMLASFYIPQALAPRPNLKVSANILIDIKLTLKKTMEKRSIFITILGISWFWAFGAVVTKLIFDIPKDILHLPESSVAVFMVIFSVGVACGTVICNKIMCGLIHPTFVPLSSIAMGFATLSMYFFSRDYIPMTASTSAFFISIAGLKISLILFTMSCFAGIYIVPLNAFLQNKAPKAYLATIISGNNMFNSLAICLLSGMLIGLEALMGKTSIILVLAFISFVISFVIMSIIPDALPRSMAQSLLSFFFKIKIKGLENYEKAGNRVLLIANHTSLLDGLLMAAFMPEKIIFAINTEIAKKWWVRIFNPLVKLYPLDPTNPLALKHLINELKEDQKCLIFPEGRITVTGALMKIYEGAGIAAVKAEANILPIRIDGAQFSKFSYLKGKTKTKFFPPITITMLPPTRIVLNEEDKGSRRRKKIADQLYDIMSTMIYKSSPLEVPLFEALLQAPKTYGEKHIIAEDINRTPINYKTFIMKSYALGAAFEKYFPEKHLGLMLPNSLANAVAFFGCQSVGKIPAMINFTQGIYQILSCIATAQVQTVITSQKMVEMLKLEGLVDTLRAQNINVVYLEEFKDKITLGIKLKAFGKKLLRITPNTNPNDPCTILFTSGSEGVPKAVLLSHVNLQANRYQLSAIFAFTTQDVMFNALPMFHSFGLSVGTILPVLSGLKVFFYPSPVHYKIVPELFYDTNATIICGTDTFFAGYAKKANPFDFYNVKYAIVGAEKLKDSTYYSWVEKFGVRILEGYGVTESSPVLSVNTPMYQKKGSVGRLLPAIEYKLEAIPGIEQGGKLLVKGDNIMLGYLKDQQIIAPENGWYDTGDIVDFDEHGYMSILGRAKRFAKIGGEMVSLTAIEDIINKFIQDKLSVVVSIPDEKKGEQLVLVTEATGITSRMLLEYFKQNFYSELWIPKKIVEVEKIPLLGTGKTDYVTVKKNVVDSLGLE